MAQGQACLLPHRSQRPQSAALAEGCFCPDGQTLFNAHTDVCVPECRKHPALPWGRRRPVSLSGA